MCPCHHQALGSHPPTTTQQWSQERTRGKPGPSSPGGRISGNHMGRLDYTPPDLAVIRWPSPSPWGDVRGLVVPRISSLFIFNKATLQ